MDVNENLFWIWLSQQLGPVNKDFPKLIHLYETPYEIFSLEYEELELIPDITPRTRQVLSDKNLQNASRILDDCEQLGIGILTFGSDRYPKLLREIPTPPVVLYYYGDLPDFNRDLFIGMVGTRSMSAYGLYSAYKISYELTRAGAVIVSGMAAGIDGVSAAAAIAAAGRTVAVLGCGVNVVYPRHHGKLHDRIRKRGVILSEYPPNEKPNNYHFPARNRIISGICQGTVVVEAGVGSGSLITAKDAIQQGRDVFALPANLGSVGAEGTNGLLRDGANLVTDASDILKPYEFVYAERLHPELLPEARTHSKADLQYLESLGVIQLTSRKTSASVPLRAVPDEPKEKKESSGKHEDQKSTERPEQSSEKKTKEFDLSSLTPVERAVLDAIPDGASVNAETFSNLGYPYGEIIAALTMLELDGMIRKQPGAMYSKE